MKMCIASTLIASFLKDAKITRITQLERFFPAKVSKNFKKMTNEAMASYWANIILNGSVSDEKLEAERPEKLEHTLYTFRSNVSNHKSSSGFFFPVFNTLSCRTIRYLPSLSQIFAISSRPMRFPAPTTAAHGLSWF